MSARLLLMILPLVAVIALAGVWLLLSGPDYSAPQRPDFADRAARAPLLEVEEADEAGQVNSSVADAVTPDQPGPKAQDPEIVRPDRAALEAALRAEQETARRLQEEVAGGAPRPEGQPVAAEAPADPLAAERDRRIAALRAIRRPPQNLGNARPRARQVRENGRRDLSEVSARLRQDRRGLYAKYYAFNRNPIEDLLDPTQPMLDARTPTLTRIDQRVYFPHKGHWADLPFDRGNFMAVWEGYLVIEQPGDYWLYIGADLFGNVRLGDQYVLMNDMNDYTEVSTVLTLSAGLHPLRVEYLEARNGSVVQELGACNFMYVPQGQTKPVPVPPEMLLLPDHLWSNDAPILTRLSRNNGAIGDEITIHGQGLGAADTGTVVEFAGQRAAIKASSDSQITVRVPVGAVNGKVVVHKPTLDGAGTIPSNSLDFRVNNQFGLFAEWHSLPGSRAYDFIGPGSRQPDLVRLERNFMFNTRDQLDLPFRNEPLACRWEGKLGLPSSIEPQRRLVRFQAYGRLRVMLGGEVRQTEAPPGPGNNLTTLDFEVTLDTERYLPLAIDWTSESGPAALRVREMGRATTEPDPANPGANWVELRTLPAHLFFPPVEPPQPPVIRGVRPIWPEGETAPALPYTVTTNRPSVREGQEFEFTIDVYGTPEVREQPVTMSIDGRPFTFTVVAATALNATAERRTCRATLPDMCGDGRMVARMSVVTSPPYHIDVTNKGLIAYLYDLPGAGGYTTMPDPTPLTCFMIRKDTQVNFENANGFNLPFPAETFIVEWFGAIIVEREGDYVFTTRSDDGVLLWINGVLTVEDNNLHYQRERSSAPVRLTPGRHTFRMQFFENNVHEVCVLYWRAREGGQEIIPKQVIPRRNFTWDEHPALPSKVGTGKLSDGSDPPN